MVFVLNSTHFHHLFSKYFILLLLGLDTHAHTHIQAHRYTAHTDAQRGCSYSTCFIQNFCKKLFRIVLRGEARRFVYVAFHMYPTTGTPWLTLAADAHLAAGSSSNTQAVRRQRQKPGPYQWSWGPCAKLHGGIYLYFLVLFSYITFYLLIHLILS